MNMENAVLITGVSGGVGFSTAKLFLSKGYKVFGLDIVEPKESLEGLVFIKTDLRKLDDVKNAFEVVKKSECKLDSIVSTAGIYDLNSLVEMSEERFTKIFDINLFGVYRINKIFLPLLKHGSKIIITTTTTQLI